MSCAIQTLDIRTSEFREEMNSLKPTPEVFLSLLGGPMPCIHFSHLEILLSRDFLPAIFSFPVIIMHPPPH